MTRVNKIGLSLVIAVALALSVIGVTAVTTYSLLNSDQPMAMSLFGQSGSAEQRTRFSNLEKFVISIEGDERTHYLLMELALKTSTDAAYEELTAYKPLAKNVLLRMFSQMSYDELRQQKDIPALQSRVHQKLTMALSANGYQHRIDEVLFTKMVIQ